MKDVDGMKKIRNWIRELQNKVAEEQMPPRYRDFTPEQWEEERAGSAEGAAEPSGDRRRQSGGYCAVLEKHRDFFKWRWKFAKGVQ